MNKTIIVLFLFLVTPLYAQENNLPMGFRGITLGLPLEEAKKAIENDGYFDYRGDPDLSMLLTENRAIIESRGKFYIESGYFQFYNEVLYTITLILDTKKIDYYTMFTKLRDKYGKFNSLSPERVIWENEKVRISLEKPLTLKYVDLLTFNQIVEDDITQEAMEEKLKKGFIDEF